jgi:hypothetical protein
MDLPALSVFVCSKVLSIAATFSYNRKDSYLLLVKNDEFCSCPTEKRRKRAYNLRDVGSDEATLKIKSKNDRELKLGETKLYRRVKLIRNISTNVSANCRLDQPSSRTIALSFRDRAKKEAGD